MTTPLDGVKDMGAAAAARVWALALAAMTPLRRRSWARRSARERIGAADGAVVVGDGVRESRG